MFTPKIYNRRNRQVPSSAEYVGRPTIFGNPFVVGRDGIRGECCDKFDVWLDTGESFGNPQATEERRQLLLSRLPELKGKDLVCWCHPVRCHAESLGRRANRVAS